MSNTGDFKIVFGGNIENLSTEVLISNLLSTTNIIHEINRELKSQYKIDVRIKPFAPGSFEIIYALVDVGLLDSLMNTITKENLEYVGSLISVFKGIFGIKKFLGGKEPTNIETKGGNTIITNNEGDTFIIDNSRTMNIYSGNQPINDLMNKSFKTIKEFNEIESFNIKDSSGEELFAVQKDEFDRMAAKNELITDDKKDEVLSNVNLILYKLVFEEGKKWSFVYDGNLISAYITDKGFFENIENYSFSKGDCMVADMKIIKEYSEVYNTFMNKEYIITKVVGFNKKDTQSAIEFPVD